MNQRRVALAAVLVMAIAAFFLLGAHRFLSVAYLKQSQATLAALYAERPWMVFASFFGIYLAVAALSIPGATVMTLGAGALFGLGPGLVLASFASSLGALLAFLGARFLLQDSVRRHFGQRLQEIDRGVEREGAMYLFTLRLVPLVPFFVINLGMGLTGMRAWTFYWVSQLGMLAGAAVYVNAGTRLGQLQSLRGILSPGVIASFALLAAFPWLARLLLRLFRQGRSFRKWNGRKPRRFDRNLVVIGAGAAGLVSAYLAAAVKASVTLVESHKMGGDCLNYGCVPSKALIRSAKLAHQIRQAGSYGLQDMQPSVHFKGLMARIFDVVRTIEPHDSVERFRGLGVDVVSGHARIVDPWTVEIAGHDGSTRRLTTRSIVIAAGARPVVPPLPGLEDVGYVTSDTLWETFAALDEIPRRLLVLGGGPIGCELAQAFARLGAQVTILETAPELLAREDAEVSAVARESLESDGVRILVGHKALRGEVAGDEKILVAESSGQELRIAFDVLLCAVGRKARLEGYGLEELGISTSRTVDTNEYLQTLYPNILAAGDVAGPFQFTHAAAHQAWYATVNALFGSLRRFKVDYRVMPAVTFLDPEIARVGVNEREAREKQVPYDLTRYDLHDLDRAVADGEARGFVKVLTVPGKDRILGATIVGSHASEILAEFVLAMKHGLGLNKILGTIHAYPTWAEANKYAAGEWRRTHQPEALLRLLHRYHAWRRA